MLTPSAALSVTATDALGFTTDERGVVFYEATEVASNLRSGGHVAPNMARGLILGTIGYITRASDFERPPWVQQFPKWTWSNTH